MDDQILLEFARICSILGVVFPIPIPIGRHTCDGILLGLFLCGMISMYH